MDIILHLPIGHWFYEAFDRLNRTSEPDGITAPVPAPGLVRESKETSKEEEWQGNRGAEGERKDRMENDLHEEGNARERRRIS